MKESLLDRINSVGVLFCVACFALLAGSGAVRIIYGGYPTWESVLFTILGVTGFTALVLAYIVSSSTQEMTGNLIYFLSRVKLAPKPKYVLSVIGTVECGYWLTSQGFFRFPIYRLADKLENEINEVDHTGQTYRLCVQKGSSPGFDPIKFSDNLDELVEASRGLDSNWVITDRRGIIIRKPEATGHNEPKRPDLNPVVVGSLQRDGFLENGW